MAMTRRDVMLGAAAVILAPARASAATATIGGPAFGSSWRATVAAPDLQAVERLISRILSEVDACFSPYRSDSDLSRFIL